MKSAWENLKRKTSRAFDRGDSSHSQGDSVPPTPDLLREQGNDARNLTIHLIHRRDTIVATLKRDSQAEERLKQEIINRGNDLAELDRSIGRNAQQEIRTIQDDMDNALQDDRIAHQLHEEVAKWRKKRSTAPDGILQLNYDQQVQKYKHRYNERVINVKAGYYAKMQETLERYEAMDQIRALRGNFVVQEAPPYA